MQWKQDSADLSDGGYFRKSHRAHPIIFLSYIFSLSDFFWILSKNRTNSAISQRKRRRNFTVPGESPDGEQMRAKIQWKSTKLAAASMGEKVSLLIRITNWNLFYWRNSFFETLSIDNKAKGGNGRFWYFTKSIALTHNGSSSSDKRTKNHGNLRLLHPHADFVSASLLQWFDLSIIMTAKCVICSLRQNVTRHSTLTCERKNNFSILCEKKQNYRWSSLLAAKDDDGETFFPWKTQLRASLLVSL